MILHEAKSIYMLNRLTTAVIVRWTAVLISDEEPCDDSELKIKEDETSDQTEIAHMNKQKITKIFAALKNQLHRRLNYLSVTMHDLKWLLEPNTSRSNNLAA